GSADARAVQAARRAARSDRRSRVGWLPDAVEQKKENPMTRSLLVLVFALASSTAHADDDVAKIMSRFDNEPSVRQTQLAAIEYYNVSPDTIQSLRARARHKALLPGLTVGGSTYKQSSSLAVDDIVYRAIGIARFEDQNGAFYGASASLTWNLDRL